MLSASTVSSISSDVLSSNTSVSTPSSQYSIHSSPKTTGNPLTDLIETEKNYLETLKIIHHQLTPLCTDTVPINDASDFSQLLKHAHDVLKANQQFCAKLIKVSANPQAIKELGDVLMQWVEDMEVPYANFSRSFISKLNQRQDIVGKPEIKQLLDSLSAKASYEITLESLFNAPVQQLKYYKVLYGRLLDSTEPGRADYHLLAKANQRIDTVMLMAQRHLDSASPSTVSDQHINRPHVGQKGLPMIETDSTRLQPEWKENECTDAWPTFQRQLDCSQVIDLYTGAPLQNFIFPKGAPETILRRDDFVLLPDENTNHNSMRVHLVLTSNMLIISQETGSQNDPKRGAAYKLLYPPLAAKDISVKAKSIDRELVGEYLLEFTILNKNPLNMRAISREVRNAWLGVESEKLTNADLTPRLLIQPKGDNNPLPAARSVETTGTTETLDAATKADTVGTSVVKETPAAVESKATRKHTVKRHDVFAFYGEDSEHVSPLSSDDSDVEETIEQVIKPELPPKTSQAQPTCAKPIADKKTLPSLPQTQSTVPALPTKDHVQKKPSPPPKVPVEQTKPLPTAQGVTDAAQTPSSRPVQMTPAEKNDSSRQNPSVATANTTVVPPVKPLPRTSSITRSTVTGVRPEGQPAQPPVRSSSIRQQQPGASNSPGNVQKPLPQPGAQPASSLPGMFRPPQQFFAPQQRPIQLQPYNQAPSPRPMHRPGSGPSPYPAPPMMMNAASNAMARPGPYHPNGQMGNRPHAPGSPVMAQHQPPGPVSSSGPGSPHGFAPSPAPSPGPIVMSAIPSQMVGQRPPFPNGIVSNRSPSPGLPSPAFSYEGPRSTSSYLSVSSRSTDDISSPPRSPTQHVLQAQSQGIRQVLYTSSQCEVFRWQSESWYAVEGQCTLQVRQTFSNQSCVTIQLQNTGQTYLNAWILTSTEVSQPQPTDVSLSVTMGNKKENYLIHFQQPAEATALHQILQRALQEAIKNGNTSSRASMPAPPTMLMRGVTLQDRRVDDDPIDEAQPQVPQTLRLVMQCKCKLFVQNEHSNWSSFGSVTMKVSQQLPSKKMHIEMENGKGPKATKLVSASVQSRNVERISPKRITFLLTNEQERTSMVYMVQIKEEQTGDKIYEYLRTKNAENGW